MSKIYIVKGTYKDEPGLNGWTEKAYKNHARAEQHREDLQSNEELIRDNIERCKRCDGDNTKCPYYIAPFFFDDGCEGRQLYHRDEEFFVEELEVE